MGFFLEMKRCFKQEKIYYFVTTYYINKFKVNSKYISTCTDSKKVT